MFYSEENTSKMAYIYFPHIKKRLHTKDKTNNILINIKKSNHYYPIKNGNPIFETVKL